MTPHEQRIAAERRSTRGPRFDAGQVRRMRVAREAGESWKEIGRRYGCDISTVQRLVREAEHGS